MSEIDRIETVDKAIDKTSSLGTAEGWSSNNAALIEEINSSRIGYYHEFWETFTDDEDLKHAIISAIQQKELVRTTIPTAIPCKKCKDGYVKQEFTLDIKLGMRVHGQLLVDGEYCPGCGRQLPKEVTTAMPEER